MSIRRVLLTALAGLGLSGAPDTASVRTAPTLFGPGVISTRDFERDGAFTPDGRAFYFTKRTIWPYFSAICVSFLRGGQWSVPEVAPFSGQYPDATPFITADGAHLYFASRRPVDGAPKRDYDLWVVDRTPAGWSEPRRLPAPVNDPGNQLSPSLARSGTLYYIEDTGSPHVVSSRPEGDSWLPPVVAGDSGEGGTAEYSAAVDPSERYLVVSVIGRSDALHSAEGIYPRTDLYLRERREGVWSPLRHLPAPINSAAEDGSPVFTPDGRSLVFTSERGGFVEHGGGTMTYASLEQRLHQAGNGLGDIYIVGLDALGIAAEAQPAPTRDPGPELFGEGIISTADDEFGGDFTADGKTVYFTKSAPHSYRYVICESHWVDGRWTTPVVAPFSGQYTDSDPVISPDGTKLLWTSDRPVDGVVKHDYDIWMVERTPAGGWSAPKHLPAPVNSDASEFFASMTRDGTLYFSSARDGRAIGAIQAYRSRLLNGVWSSPENISRVINGPDSAAYYDLDVMIDPAERYVLLGSAGRPDGFGNFDLYIAWRRGDGWSRPIHLPAPFNTRARDYSPHLTPDGKSLMFSSERGFALDSIAHRLDYAELTERLRGVRNGSGNIYRIDARKLESYRAP